jgi:hypothetical protein
MTIAEPLSAGLMTMFVLLANVLRAVFSWCVMLDRGDLSGGLVISLVSDDRSLLMALGVVLGLHSEGSLNLDGAVGFSRLLL